MKKSIFTIFLALLSLWLCASACAAQIVADGSCGASDASVLWVLDDGACLTITGTGAMDDFSVGTAPWQQYAANIRTAVIESGVTSVGQAAFQGCTSLTSVSLPETVTAIGANAFSGCVKLGDTILPSGLTKIADDTFRECAAIASVTIPEGVTEIGKMAFCHCSSLKQLKLPESLNTVGEDAFSRCPLARTVLPEHITSFGQFSSGLSDAGRVRIDSDTARAMSASGSYFFGLTGQAMYRYAFDANGEACDLILKMGDVGKREVVDPLVTIIGVNAFADHSLNEEIVLPNGLKEIKATAFANCSALTTMVIPNSVTAIALDALKNCPNLTITCATESPAVAVALACNVAIETPDFSIDRYGYLTEYRAADQTNLDMLPEGLRGIGAGALMGNAELVRAHLPSTVAEICADAFNGCTALTDLELPAGLRSVGARAFLGCSGLPEITLPDNITNFSFEGASNSVLHAQLYTDTAKTVSKAGLDFVCGEYTYRYLFSGSTVNGLMVRAYTGNAAQVTIADKVTEIGDYVFQNHTELERVVLPGSVTRIDNSAFRGCSNLESINLDGLTGMGMFAFADCTSLNVEDISALGYGAFKNCESLRYVCLGEQITSVPQYAFQNASELRTVDFGSRVTSIGNYAFENCVKLCEANIPNCELGYHSFYKAHIEAGLGTDLAIRLSRASCDFFIYDDFGLCYIFDDLSSQPVGLRLDHYSGNAARVEIPTGVTVLANNCFDLSTAAVEELVIPEGVMTIEGVVLKDCTTLRSVTLPTTLTSIGDDAFWGCTALTDVVLPEGLTNIGRRAFCNTGIKSIVLPESLESMSYSVFADCSALESVTILTDMTDYSYRPFEGDTAIREVCIKDLTHWMSLSGNGLPNAAAESAALVVDGVEISELYIPEGIETVNSCVFANFTGITTVHFPASVKTIEGSAFEDCIGITSLTIPETVTEIEWGALYGCNGLQEITLPYIGSKASGGYSNFCVIFGNSGIGHMLSQAEREQRGLVLQRYYNNSTNYFYLPKSLRKVTITSTADVPAYAFMNCNTIQEIVLPDAVKAFGDYAFQNCTNLELTLPTALETVGRNAFYDMNHIHCRPEQAKALEEQIASAFFIGHDLCYLPGDETFGWRAYGDTVELVKYTGEAAEVEVPAFVTRLGQSVFADHSEITSLVLPEGMDSISSLALKNCSGLTELTIPDSVTQLDNTSLNGCTSLKKLTVPYFSRNMLPADSGLEEVVIIRGMDPEALKGFTGLRKVTFGEQMTTIPDSAFYGCTSLETIEWGGVQSVGSYGFYGCTSLETIEWDGVQSIGSYGFAGCTSLTELKLGENVQSVGWHAFDGCSQLKTVTLNDSLTLLDSYAFANCSALKEVYLGKSLTKLNAYTFKGCTELTELVIPDSVTEVAKYALNGVSNLRSLTLPFVGASRTTGSGYAESTFGYIFGNLTYTGSVLATQHYSSNKGQGYCIPESLRTVTVTDMEALPDAAFEECSMLTEVNLCDTIKEIGLRAFSQCTGLTKFPAQKVETIGGGAFNRCTGLTDVVFSENLLSVGGNAFGGCTGLETILIPDSIQEIGGNAFANCTNAVITLPSVQMTVEKDSFSGVKRLYCEPDAPVAPLLQHNFIKPGYDAYALLVCSGEVTIVGYEGEDTVVVIPDFVTAIGENTFKDHTEITNVTFTSNLKQIGRFAFENCTGLTSLTLPKDLEDLGYQAFSGCSNLTITLPDNIVTYGSYALNGVKRIECDRDSVTAKELGRSYVDFFDPKEPDWQITIDSNGITTVGYYGSEQHVIVPAWATGVGYQTFESAPELRTVVIPDTVTGLGLGLFANCAQIEEITLPFMRSWLGHYFTTDSANGNVVQPVKYYNQNNYSYTRYRIPTSLRKITITGGDTLPYNAFENCTMLQTIVLPATLKTVTGAAFSNCTGLTSIVYDGSLAQWANIDFEAASGNPMSASGCTLTINGQKLTSVVLPEGMTAVKPYVFAGNRELTSVVLPDTIETVGDYAFSDCTSLTELTLSGSLASIGEYAFARCAALTEIELPASLKTLGHHAFESCQFPMGMLLPDEITEIGYRAIPEGIKIICDPCSGTAALLGSRDITYEDFVYSRTDTDVAIKAYKGNETELVIPEYVTKIGSSAFAFNDTLTCIVVPDNVKVLDGNVFYNCSNLEVWLPDNLTTAATNNCMSIKRVYCNPKTQTSAQIGNYWLPGTDCVLNEKSGLVTLVRYEGTEEVVELPQGIQAISGAFWSTQARKIIVPEGVVTIQQPAFKGSNLEELVLPDTLRSIGNYAFGSCDKLVLRLPDNITELGALNLNGNVKQVICTPFTSTSALLGQTRFSMPGYPEYSLTEQDGRLVVYDYEGSYDQIIIPAPIDSFTCTYYTIKSVRLPADLDADCTFDLRAESVTIPDGVTNAGTLTLRDCSTLCVPECMEEFDGITIIGRTPTIMCYEGSTAELWAMVNEYPVHLINGGAAECTLTFTGALPTLEIGQSVTVDADSFTIAPIPVHYVGQITLTSDTLDINGMTVTALTAGDHTLTAVLDGKYSVDITVRVWLAAESITLKAPAFCTSGNTFTVSVESILPEGISGYLTWAQDGEVCFADAETAHTFTVTSDAGTSTVITATAPGGVQAAATILVPAVISDPYLASATVEVGDPILIQVDVDGTVFTNDPTCYGAINLTDAQRKYVSLENGVLTTVNVGKVALSIKNLQGKTKYLSVTIVDTQHNLRTAVERVEPTCVETGMDAHEKCCFCDTTFDANGNAMTVEDLILPELGHIEEILTAVDATCTETGLTEGKKCTVCGETLVAQEVVPAKGHVEEVLTAVDATCTETGLTEGKKCTVCDETLVAQEIVPAKGHVEEILTAVDATCTETGLTEGKKCSVCEEILVAQEIMPAKGHVEEVLSAVEATCTETGLTEGKKCSVCEEILIAQEIVPAKGHIEEVLSAVEATCTETGLTEGMKCSVCEEILVAQEIVPAKGHVEEILTVVDATCTETGLTEGKKCSVCGEILVAQEVVPAKGHVEEVLAAVEATCTETGLTEGKKCSVCGEILVAQETVPAKGHDEEILTAVDATCTETGLTEGKKCTVCGEILTEREVIEKIAHDYVLAEVWPAEGTEDGIHGGFRCSRCFDELMPAVIISADRQLKLPGMLETVGEEAFVGINAQQVIIYSGVKTIESRAFANCADLRIVVIPSSVLSIAPDAFEGCTDLVFVVSDLQNGTYVQEWAAANGIPCIQQ